MFNIFTKKTTTKKPTHAATSSIKSRRFDLAVLILVFGQNTTVCCIVTNVRAADWQNWQSAVICNWTANNITACKAVKNTLYMF